MSAAAAFEELKAQGLTFTQIAERHGVTRNVVAGALFRARQPRRERSTARNFRNPALVKMAVSLADEIGLMEAARRLKIDGGQLCRWRQLLRSMEAA